MRVQSASECSFLIIIPFRFGGEGDDAIYPQHKIKGQSLHPPIHDKETKKRVDFHKIPNKRVDPPSHTETAVL